MTRTPARAMRAGLALSTALCAATADAWAVTEGTELPVITLDMAGCPVNEPEVKRLLEIELEARVIGPASRTGDMSSVVVTCAQDVYRIVVVSRTDPSKMRRRELDLASTGPKARARFLSLAMVELITVPDAAHTASRPQSTTLVQAGESVQLRETPPRVFGETAIDGKSGPGAPGIRAQVGGMARTFPTGGGRPVNWGATLRLAVARGAVDLACDLVGETGSTGLTLGNVGTRAVSVGPTVGVHGTRGRLAWRAGGGARFGVAQVQGHPADDRPATSDAFVAPWGGPFAAAGGSFRFARAIALEMGAEVGWSALAIEARTVMPEGSQSVSWRGPWVAVGLSVGWQIRRETRGQLP